MADYPLVQARNYTRGPRRGPIELIVVHTMEWAETHSTAEDCARYFATTTRDASSHYCIDDNSIIRSVRDEDIAYCAPGANHNGIHLEHAGRARQSPAEWADPFSMAMLERSAKLSADLCRKYGIPAIWLSPDDLKAGRRGFTSHNNVSLAFRRSDHTDPGVNFPADYYLSRVKYHLRFRPTLRFGDKGESVRKLQEILKINGYGWFRPNGKFGVFTRAAVRNFQKKNRIPVSGVVGPRTWAALES